MTLESGWEDAAAEAALDAAAARYLGNDGFIPNAIEAAHERLREYAREFDYRIESVIDSLQGPEIVEQSDRHFRIRFGWDHEAAPYLEWGTSEHTIEGDPILSFIWEDRHDPPEWVAEEYEREGGGYRVFLPEVEVAGVRETRFARHALDWLRREVAS
ncbi:hypothetical protein [Halorubrum halodurans]|uniref:Uncharacterized protein n=1 Tax=Halorubrum halodurans TaxID=1383851 RepID=A0A256ICR3_9EURY|nr:hypothetical protein [Halorubrum halodurans]OYR54329.1 hypothetical protein DJ70_14185 [Halorubrum halodurans]